MKKKYPAICNGLPDNVLDKLNRYTKGIKDKIENAFVDINEEDFNTLNDEDKISIKLKGIRIRPRPNYHPGSTLERFSRLFVNGRVEGAGEGRWPR